MSEPRDGLQSARLTDPAFARWRRVHRSASFVLAGLGALHSALTPVLYRAWSPGAVWFLGTGLGLLLLSVMNLAHVGLVPCTLPTAPAVRAANWVFLLFGIGALIAVPQPQAVVIVVALVAQAVGGHHTLPGAGPVGS
ncbi:MAG TPA: hypothetical protein VD793_02075 [Gemmatimonadales bacterium]|nr:hypothetical protein [Gemmatimonadales bacterium]